MSKSKTIWYFLYVFGTRLFPFVLIADVYGMFEEETPGYFKVAAFFMIIGMWIALKFWGDFMEYVRNLPESYMKSLIKYTLKLTPFVLILIVVLLAEMHIERFKFIAIWVLISNIFGVFAGARHDYLVRQQLLERGYVQGVLPR